MKEQDLKNIQNYGFINYLLKNGAKISPLEINYDENEIFASMNPSIWVKDGIGYINIRAVNYNLFNSKYREYTQEDQPIAYINKDSYHLITENFFGTINLETLEIEDISKVKMMKLHEPNWDFVGLEDARIICWDDNIYLCGVRRDIKDNGEGRMELTKIVKNNDEWEEIDRIRIPAAEDDTAYLEKNWLPIVDKPFTWLKWAGSMEWCSYDKSTNKLDIWFTNSGQNIPYRGDSHLIHIGGYYYCFSHLVLNKQLNPDTNSRISYYCHYILRFNEDLSFAGVFGPFSYDNRFNIEFGCGLAFDGENCYLTYSENDACAYIIKFNYQYLTNLPFTNN